MWGVFRKGLSWAALVFVAGCVAIPFGTKSMQERIEADLAMYNAAYSDAINNQMLWNILRARDRLPTQYSGINALSAIEKRSISGNFSIGSLRLGSTFDKNPWGMGTIGGSGSAETDPTYGITPMGGDNFIKAVLSPTTAEVFNRYWQNGWPPDMLLAVLVKNAIKLSDDPDAPIADNCIHAGGLKRLQNKIDEMSDKAATPFLVWARGVKVHMDGVQSSLMMLRQCDDAEPKAATAVAKPKGKHRGKTRAAAAAPQAAERAGPQSFVLRIALASGPAVASNPDAGVWELDLRSLDEAVYYLGELIRDEAPPADQSFGVAYGPDIVTAADCHEGPTAAAPLFRVFRMGGDSASAAMRALSSAATDFNKGPRLYAAQMHYGGSSYAAGPSALLHAQCHGANTVDRTGDVLVLLTQVLQANLNPDSLRSAVRFISN